VKYKVSKDWRRPDLYQAVVFAAAAGTVHAAIVGFAADQLTSQPMVQFGDISVHAIDWIADPSFDPEVTANHLAEPIEAWLESCWEPDDPEERRHRRAARRGVSERVRVQVQPAAVERARAALLPAAPEWGRDAKLDYDTIVLSRRGQAGKRRGPQPKPLTKRAPKGRAAMMAKSVSRA